MISRFFVVILIVLPIIEIWGLITVGKMIGVLDTIGLLLLSGLIGVYLAIREGRRVWALARVQLNARQMPTQSILDGICIVVGGLMLIVPGFISDILGILLIIPITRGIFRIWLVALIMNRFSRGSTHIITRR
jgi:UPF0716 protein FxsA